MYAALAVAFAVVSGHGFPVTDNWLVRRSGSRTTAARAVETRTDPRILYIHDINVLLLSFPKWTRQSDFSADIHSAAPYLHPLDPFARARTGSIRSRRVHIIGTAADDCVL